MHPNVSINTLCFAPGSLAAQVEMIARIRARAVTPDLAQILQPGVSQSAALFRDAGLEVAALTHRAFGFATPEAIDAERERLIRTIEIAATIAAPTIVMTTGGRSSHSWSDAAQRFAEAVAPCAQFARQAGIALGVEPTSHLYADASILHNLSDTTRVCRQAGIGVIIDLFACWVDADIENAIFEAGKSTALVQVSDYVPGDRALPCRAIPGDGTIPLDRLIPAIVESGYRGWFDLEIIGPRLRAEGDGPGLCRAGKAIGRILTQAGLGAVDD